VDTKMKNSIDKGNHMGELVVKSNDLINASYNLGVVEQRLLLLCIIAARKKDRVLSPSDIFYIHASEYIEQFDVDRSVAYRALAEGIKGIYDSEIKLTSNSRKKLILDGAGKLNMMKIMQLSELHLQTMLFLLFLHLNNVLHHMI
jgi:plasmid replication initiation protein